MFSRRIPLADLVDVCRVLRHQLGAGLGVLQVMKQQSQRGRPSFRRIAGRLSEAIEQGSSLGRALDAEKDAFPPLFLSMVKLAEATGHIAEIFGELERYYQLELTLRRQFRSQTFLPIAQFFFAVAIIAGVIYLVGMLAAPGTKPLLTIFGLSGAAGAGAFLGVVLGTLILLASLFFVIAQAGRQAAWMDRVLLGTPALGGCLYALAMSRFTLALQLTLDSGLSITKALRLSLEATGNAQFAQHADGIALSLKNGDSLHEALERSGLFTSDFLEMILSSEASGSVPEMMRHLAGQYQEETSRKMTMLTRVAGGAVWCAVAAFIIWAIFRLAGVYFDALGGKF
ncbi:MAG TPA: type II secretion system F family protein [Gemmataceae bacterium]|nr:type II secretion system F family protein [Gemmataceae bacterium]